MTDTVLKKINRVDEDLLREIRNKIVRAANPEKIVLFGSYVYGKPTDQSDLDILVVMKSDLPRYRRSRSIYRCLAGLLIPKDILVYTPEEIEEWDEVPQAFISTVMRQGKVIYEKEFG